VEACLANGHAVTLFHRGKSNPRAFPDVENIIGDRDISLDAIRDRHWDVVFDTSGYEVGPVRRAAEAVAKGNARYVYVSSLSVYSELLPNTNESAPVLAIPDAEHAPLSLEIYGALKAACEVAVRETLPDRALCVRAGAILGPHDYDDRFAYWLRRIAKGGEVLAPGEPNAIVQFVDVRDLAVWMVRAAERRVRGVFNATGPGEPMTMRSLLEMIREVTQSDARFTWVPSELLVKRGVAPYSEMPFWLPSPYDACSFDVSRAVEAGLTYRPAVQTVRDTWHWLQNGWEAEAPARAERRLRIPAGISAERESELLAEAHARSSGR
jgi:2'-hydroxyisoflavone reductase